MQFDWYDATIPAFPSLLETSLCEKFGGKMEPARPVSPFKIGNIHSETGFKVYHGGHNPWPFFRATGGSAVAGAEFVRKSFPIHRVTRADVAMDWDVPGAFDDLAGIVSTIARAAGVRVIYMGDPDPAQTSGRTMYYGSKSSDVRICLYEKGLKERAQGLSDASPHWVRLELRIRPRKDRKTAAAGMSEDELFGFARWTAKIAEDVVGFAPTFVPDLSKRQSTVDRAIAHMLAQYGGTMAAFVRLNSHEILFNMIREATDIGDDS